MGLIHSLVQNPRGCGGKDLPAYPGRHHRQHPLSLPVVNGKLDAQNTYANTEELAREAESAGVKVTYVLYEDGSHVCFNIPHKYRPFVGDWMADHLKAG